MVTSALSTMQGTFAMEFALFLLVVGGLVWYALCTKGDVRAAFSHGKTVLELEAKERNAKNF